MISEKLFLRVRSQCSAYPRVALRVMGNASLAKAKAKLCLKEEGGSRQVAGSAAAIEMNAASRNRPPS